VETGKRKAESGYRIPETGKIRGQKAKDEVQMHPKLRTQNSNPGCPTLNSEP
jgi:hypothetical protein